MDERLKLIARLLDGEKMAVLCRQFGISRKTGYKILTRYNEIGLEGLTDRSRRPYRHANQLPFQIETQIVRLKQDRPSWGAPKIRGKLARLYPDVHTPAISTVHAVLDRHGLVKRRMGRRNRAKGTALSLPGQPNDLWCSSLYLILQTASFWRWPIYCRWWSGSDHFFPRNRDGVKECLQRRLAEAPAALMRSLLVVAFDP